MSATVRLHCYRGIADDGEPGCHAAVNVLHFRTTDDNDDDAEYPIRKPSTGVNYSFWKQVALVAETPPDSFINNIRIYPGSSYDWTDSKLYIDQVDNYEQATGAEGVTGDVMTEHEDNPTLNDLSSYSEGSPFTVDGSIAVATGRINDGYIILQVAVGANENIGYSGTDSIMIRWDEA